MDDTISRQAAIDALVGVTMFKTKHEIMQRVNASVQDEQGWLGAVAECLDEIEDLPSAQPDVTDTNVGDTISRQAVLQRLTDIAYNSCKTEGQAQVIDWAKTLVCVMPSAQPDITDEQAIGHLQASGWMQSHDKQMYEMGLKERLADDSDSYDALLPSSQPERKKGKWTDDNACPFCGFQPWYERDIQTLSYCPNCGADMRGERNESNNKSN